MNMSVHVSVNESHVRLSCARRAERVGVRVLWQYVHAWCMRAHGGAALRVCSGVVCVRRRGAWAEHGAWGAAWRVCGGVACVRRVVHGRQHGAWGVAGGWTLRAPSAP